MKLSNSQKNFLRFIGLRLANFAVNVLLKSVRIESVNSELIKRIESEGKNYISAFWHGNMVIGWYLNRNQNFSALVSKSKDGDLLAHVLQKWGYNVVRGSSHIGGKEALEMMTDLLKQKYSLAITPDGPTGPIYKMKAGAVVASKKTGVPLVLMGIGCKNKIVFKSWDRFEVPKPFARVKVIYSEPLFFDNELSYDETSRKIEECELLLNSLRKEALESC